MKIVLLGIIFMVSALITADAKPSVTPGVAELLNLYDKNAHIEVANADQEGENEVARLMMIHLVASMMQVSDDGKEDLMAVMMGEGGEGSKCAESQIWKHIKKIGRGVKNFVTSPTGKALIKYGVAGLKTGLHLVGKK